MQSKFAATAHWRGNFEEAAFQAWAHDLRGQLGTSKVSLGLVFITPKLFGQAQQILEILRVDGQIPLLAGCSSNSLIVGSEELEDDTGLVVALYSLPGAELKAFHFTQQDLDQADSSAYWHHKTGIAPDKPTAGWCLRIPSIWIVRPGLAVGMKLMHQLPCWVGWRAVIIATRRRRFI